MLVKERTSIEQKLKTANEELANLSAASLTELREADKSNHECIVGSVLRTKPMHPEDSFISIQLGNQFPIYNNFHTAVLDNGCTVG